MYFKTPPSGSVLSKSLRIVKLAGKGKWTSPKALNNKEFWETPKPSNIAPEDRPSWMTFDDGTLLSFEFVRGSCHSCRRRFF